jgi:hypothetical protein
MPRGDDHTRREGEVVGEDPDELDREAARRFIAAGQQRTAGAATEQPGR